VVSEKSRINGSAGEAREAPSVGETRPTTLIFWQGNAACEMLDLLTDPEILHVACGLQVDTEFI
jgi:hypothetical protein